MKISHCLFTALLFAAADAASAGPMDATLQPVKASAPASRKQADGPSDLVRDLYRDHDRDLRSENNTILSGKDRKLLDKYFDRSLANLIWKYLTNQSDEAGVIDFDVFYNTQDPQITKLRVGQAVIKGEKATVRVTFANFGTKVSVTYSLTNEGGNWKIADIYYGGGFTLLKYFTEGA